MTASIEPLDGIQVLELSRVLDGAWCAQMVGDRMGGRLAARQAANRPLELCGAADKPVIAGWWISGSPTLAKATTGRPMARA